MANKTLSQLYTKHPAAKDAFSKFRLRGFQRLRFTFMILGGAGGSGVAVNNATKQETFMKMAEFQPGLCFGAAKFRLVFILETLEAFNSFVTSGWEAGANAMASAKTRAEGGALAGAVTVSKADTSSITREPSSASASPPPGTTRTRSSTEAQG